MTQRIDRQRRLVLGAAGAACLAPLLPARAAGFPDKPVRLLVPFPPGGITDVIARSFARDFQQSTAQTLIVENRPGASGVIATEAVVRSPADGYTVLMVAIGQAVINNYLIKKLPYDPKTDLLPVSLIAQGPNVLVVRTDSRLNTVSDLLAAAKADPGKLNFGSYGNGSSPHLCAAMLGRRTGTSFTHIQYKGAAPAMTDLLGGHIDFMFDSLITSLPNLRAGKIRALAITSTTRNALIPDVPTLSEAGVDDFSMQAWYGIHVPGKTPAGIVDRLAREVGQFVSGPAVRQQFADQGLELVANSPAEYARFLASENTKWGTLIKGANISID